ncbi:hypothetical protein EDF60_1688 [Leucobacter luti]|uniref:hypothetical protein n=1 Tax=Leucobacter luti TaxID=340320 RepID=UPI00104302C1|nr:hypothetical protein [Leucobacter luti]MCW2287037.1 hypothetical protein [Leucobacter luti]TCK41262.1 hypothetical protein EDF60_1688 [Leucobacter luti]
MIRAHRDAVIADLETRLQGAVFKSYSAAKGSRYAVVFVALSSKLRTRYAGGQWRHVYTVTVHSVGEDEDSALWVQERVDKLTGVTLAVAGRKLDPVEFITAQPPNLDDDGPKPLWFTITQFDIISDPA